VPRGSSPRPRSLTRSLPPSLTHSLTATLNRCHLAEGMVDSYWQFNLKPWDAAAGIVIAEEAGARISTADGTAYSVFDK
jgi:fructose-1,6-bisphosphatase/inositol monophosphatase family enzyme